MREERRVIGIGIGIGLTTCCDFFGAEELKPRMPVALASQRALRPLTLQDTALAPLRSLSDGDILVFWPRECRDPKFLAPGPGSLGALDSHVIRASLFVPSLSPPPSPSSELEAEDSGRRDPRRSSRAELMNAHTLLLCVAWLCFALPGAER